MIQAHTRLKVVDNSGAKEAMCLRVLGGSSHKVAQIGKEIIVVIKKAQTIAKKKTITKKKVERKQIHRALIIGTKKEIRREDGTRLRFNENLAILVNAIGMPLGTRIKSPLALELKKPRYHKILFLAHAYV